MINKKNTFNKNLIYILVVVSFVFALGLSFSLVKPTKAASVDFAGVLESQNNASWENDSSMTATYLVFSDKISNTNQIVILDGNFTNRIKINGVSVSGFATLMILDSLPSGNLNTLVIVIGDDDLHYLKPTSEYIVTTLKIESGATLGGTTFPEVTLYLNQEGKWDTEYPANLDLSVHYSGIYENNVIDGDKGILTLQYEKEIPYFENNGQDRVLEDEIGLDILIDGTPIRNLSGCSVVVPKNNQTLLRITYNLDILRESVLLHISNKAVILGANLDQLDLFYTSGNWVNINDRKEVVFDRIVANNKVEVSGEYELILTQLSFVPTAVDDNGRNVLSFDGVDDNLIFINDLGNNILINDKGINTLNGAKLTIVKKNPYNTIQISMLKKDIIDGKLKKLTIKEGSKIGLGIIGEDVELYLDDNGKWFKGNNLTVTYRVDGETYFSSYFEEGEKIIQIDDPVMEKRGFEYWSNSGVVFDFESTPRDSIVLDAVWKNYYKIRFLSEGTVLADSLVEEGTIPKYIGDNPTKEGNRETVYVFSGWDKELAEATEDTDYSATFNAEKRKYLVKITCEEKVDTLEYEYGSVLDLSGYEKEGKVLIVLNEEGEELPSLIVNEDVNIKLSYVDIEEKKGCGSSMTGSSFLILISVLAITLVSRKMKMNRGQNG